MEPSDKQLRTLYRLIKENWTQSRLLYEFGPDGESLTDDRCFVAVLGTPVDGGMPDMQTSKCYLIYQDGDCLDEDDIPKGNGYE